MPIKNDHPRFWASEYSIVSNSFTQDNKGATNEHTHIKFPSFRLMLSYTDSIPNKLFDFFSLTGVFKFEVNEEQIYFKIPKLHPSLDEMDVEMTPCLIDLQVMFGPQFKEILANYLQDDRT